MKSDEGGMKDIDFDELDRAVNSVIGTQADETAPTAAQDEPSRAPAAPASPTSDTPADSTSVAPPVAPASTPSPEPSTPPKIQNTMPAARRGGRFMDVVHPSADMKQPATPPSKKISLAPLHQDIKPSEPTVPEADPVGARPAEVSTDTASVAPTAPAWPDPLDVADTTVAEGISATEASDSTTDTPEVAQLPQTPFLHHTKVEKRPLGAFAETAAEGESTDAEPLSFTEKMEQEAAQQAKKGSDESDDDIQMVPSPDLPPEYHPDLVAIESKEMTIPELDVAVPERDSTPVATEETAPALESSDKAAPEASHQEKAKPAQASTEPASIPPQYRPQDVATDDSELHAVFDTQAYHQPLLPAKTRHRMPVWAWVLLIIGLLIAGAGLGALFFILGY